MKTIRLRVELREVVPAVIRVLDVPATASLPEVHDLLQAGIGWTDSHLHQFVSGDTRYGVPDDDSWDLEERDESKYKLSDLPTSFVYLYDFGDSWAHDVTVLGPGDGQPGCRYGSGACPPEDCGGSSGYEDLLQVLADPDHPEHEDMKTWAGEIEDFDLTRADQQVRNTAGAVPVSVRLILDMAKDGVKLTPGGRLPRVFVRKVQELRPAWHPFDGLATTEEDVTPLHVLHHVLRKVGLLRLSKGVVAPTKIAGNDLEVIRRLRSWFTEDEFVGQLAGDAVSLLIADGPQTTNALAARIYPLLDRWSVNGHPITERDITLSLHQEGALLQALDLVEANWSHWGPGPSAGSLLVRATSLAAYWTRGTRL